MTGQRFRELDGLRGIAAVGVVISHFAEGYESHYTDSATPFPGWWGGYGVQLFFFISGYVILMSAQRARRPSDFVISRVSRLYPTYWIALTGSLALTLIFAVPHTSFPWLDRVMNYTMIQRWFLLENVDSVYWTLAIEMQFYALIFILLVWTRCALTARTVLRVSLAWVGVAVVVALSVGSATRGLDPQAVDTKRKVLTNLVLSDWAPFFSAGMCAYLARQGARRYFWWMFAFVASAIFIGAYSRGTRPAIGYAVASVIFVLVVLRPRTQVLLTPPLQWFGKVSYSLYVCHAIPGLILMHALIGPIGRIPAMIVSFGCVCGLAALLNHYGEEKASRAFRRWLQRRLDLRRSGQPQTTDFPA